MHINVGNVVFMRQTNGNLNISTNDKGDYTNNMAIYFGTNEYNCIITLS